MTETTRPNRMTKPQRQHRITRLLEAQAVTSQGQLAALLACQGVEAPDRMSLCDLEDLGAVKVRLPGGETAYALHREFGQCVGRLATGQAHLDRPQVLQVAETVVWVASTPGRPGGPPTGPGWSRPGPRAAW